MIPFNILIVELLKMRSLNCVFQLISSVLTKRSTSRRSMWRWYFESYCFHQKRFVFTFVLSSVMLSDLDNNACGVSEVLQQFPWWFVIWFQIARRQIESTIKHCWKLRSFLKIITQTTKKHCKQANTKLWLGNLCVRESYKMNYQRVICIHHLRRNTVIWTLGKWFG